MLTGCAVVSAPDPYRRCGFSVDGNHGTVRALTLALGPQAFGKHNSGSRRSIFMETISQPSFSRWLAGIRNESQVAASCITFSM